MGFKGLWALGLSAIVIGLLPAAALAAKPAATTGAAANVTFQSGEGADLVAAAGQDDAAGDEQQRPRRQDQHERRAGADRRARRTSSPPRPRSAAPAARASRPRPRGPRWPRAAPSCPPRVALDERDDRPRGALDDSRSCWSSASRPTIAWLVGILQASESDSGCVTLAAAARRVNTRTAPFPAPPCCGSGRGQEVNVREDYSMGFKGLGALGLSVIVIGLLPAAALAAKPAATTGAAANVTFGSAGSTGQSIRTARRRTTTSSTARRSPSAPRRR